MSDILNISQSSQNYDPRSNNSIKAKIHKEMIEKERQKFIEELLFETGSESISDGINQKTVLSKRHNLDVRNEKENHENIRTMCGNENKCPKSKTEENSKILIEHDISQLVKVDFGKNDSQGSEPMQISLDLEEELSKEVERAFEMMKNNNGIGTNVSETNHVEKRQTSHIEYDFNEECSKQGREEGEEVHLRRNITDNMKRALKGSGLNVIIPRLEDSEEKYPKSCIDHEGSKRIVDEDTYRHSSTKSARNKKVPMMGTTALLQKTSIDHADYIIIQDLILSKYSTKIREYLERNHKRRKSRCEHFEEYLLADQYTPSSISSLDYINSSEGYDQKTFSSLERDNSQKNMSCYSTSSPVIQNQTRSYSINDISKDSQTSCSSLSEPDSSRSGCFGNSTKIISQEVEESFLQKPGLKGSRLGECMQYLERHGTVMPYDRQYSHDTNADAHNADHISYEVSATQISDKNSSSMKSSDDLDVHSPANNSMCSTYSVSKFIANALDGVNQEHDNNNETLESASYQTPHYTSIDESITTSKISDLLSKESTLTNRRQLIRSNSFYDGVTSQELELLTSELSIQNQILLQASKAVKHCRAKNILHTTGYIEAERILLLTCK
ncbi:unnamed protein product, partial [Callosobruchus maculatus]